MRKKKNEQHRTDVQKRDSGGSRDMDINGLLTCCLLVALALQVIQRIS